MNTRAIASVAVFFLGALSILFSIDIFQVLISLPYYPEDIEGRGSLFVLAYAIPASLLVTTGVVLMMRRHFIANWIVSDSLKEEQPLPDRQVGIAALLFAVLGVYLVVSTLPAIASLGGQVAYTQHYAGMKEFAQSFWSNVAHYLGTVAQFVIGAILFISARRIARWWMSGTESQGQPVSSASPLPSCPHCGAEFDPSDYRANQEVKRCSSCGSQLPESLFTVEGVSGQRNET